MKYSPIQYAQALYEALHSTKPEQQEQILDNFAGLLRQNGDLGRFSEIEAAFHQYEKEQKGVRFAEVTTARKLSGADEERIIKELNDYVGGKVELKQKVDEGLLGGVVVRIGDEMIDGSVKRSLQDLKNNLMK